MKVDSEINRRAAVASEARRYLGARFKLGGREPATGIDCAWVILIAARAVGYECRGLDFNFSLLGNFRQIQGAIDKCFIKIPNGAASIGDVIVLALRPGTAHLGLITSDKPKMFLHAMSIPYNRVVEHSLHSPFVPGARATWKDLLFEAYRFRPVTSYVKLQTA